MRENGAPFRGQTPIGIGEDGRTYVFLVPCDSASADRFPDVPRAPRGAAPSASGVDGARSDSASPDSRDPSLSRMPFGSRSDCRFARRSWTNCGGSSRQGGVRPARRDERFERAQTRLWRHRVFKRCIAHGSNRETARSTRSSRPRWLMRSRDRRAEFEASVLLAQISASRPFGWNGLNAGGTIKGVMTGVMTPGGPSSPIGRLA